MFTAQILLRNAGQCGVTHAHNMACTWYGMTMCNHWLSLVLLLCSVFLSGLQNFVFVYEHKFNIHSYMWHNLQSCSTISRWSINTVSPLFIKVHQLWVEAFSADYSKHRAVCKVSCIARQETKNILCCSEWFEELVVTCHLSTSQM